MAAVKLPPLFCGLFVNIARKVKEFVSSVIAARGQRRYFAVIRAAVYLTVNTVYRRLYAASIRCGNRFRRNRAVCYYIHAAALFMCCQCQSSQPHGFIPRPVTGLWLSLDCRLLSASPKANDTSDRI